jgi:hypothetical protein
MANPEWYKTINLSEFTPITLTEQDRGRRFLLANGNIRKIGTFSRFSPDNNRAYFIFNDKPNQPFSVSINPLNGYKVYTFEHISKMGTYPLTTLSTELQKNIAGYYGGKRTKRVKKSKRTKRKSRKSRKPRK